MLYMKRNPPPRRREKKETGGNVEVLMKTKIDDLLKAMNNSRFGLTIAAAKRARQINNYFRHLGDGLGREAGPQVTSASNKALTLALEEIAQEKLDFEIPEDGTK